MEIFLFSEDKICLISIGDEYTRDEYIELGEEGMGGGRTRSFEMADLKSIREGGRAKQK